MRIRQKAWPSQPKGSNVYTRLVASTILEHTITQNLDEGEQPVTMNGEVVGIIQAKTKNSNEREFFRKGTEEPNFSLFLPEERVGGGYSRKAVIGENVPFSVPLESVHILWEGAVIGLGGRDTTPLATVIGFNKEKGSYTLRMHGSEELLEGFDPTATNYFQLNDTSTEPYPAGTHLAVLYENRWQDASVVMHLGHAQGCRYKVRIDGSEVVMDLNRTNHCPSKVDNVNQYLDLLQEYLTRASEESSKLEDSLTGRQIDTLTQTIDVGLMEDDDDDESDGDDDERQVNFPRHVEETRKCREDLHNIHDVAKLVQNWVQVGSVQRGSGSIKGCPLLMRAIAGAGKTWSTKQLMAILSADAKKASPQSVVPLLITVQDLMFRARRAGVEEIKEGFLEWYLRDRYGDEGFLGMLQDAYQSRRVVIILDGLDEAASSRSKLEQYLLRSLVPAGFVIVVTSRPEGVDFGLYKSSFLRMELKELSTEQQRAIIEHQMDEGKNKEFFTSLLDYMKARSQLNNIYKEHCKNPSSIEKIPESDTTMDSKKHLDSSRQVNLEGNVVSTPAELEAVAKECKPVLDEELRSLCRLAGLNEDQLKLVSNKSLETAVEKCEKKYPEINGFRSGPPIAWARDIVRSSILCVSGEQLLRVCEAISSHRSLEVVRVKNYFSTLTQQTSGGST